MHTLYQMQRDKRTREKEPKIWVYTDKTTGKPKGDATVSYEDAQSAVAAVKWFNGR